MINELLYRRVKLSPEETSWFLKVLEGMKHKEKTILKEVQSDFKAEIHTEMYYALSSIMVLRRKDGFKIHLFAIPYLISGLTDFIRYLTSRGVLDDTSYIDTLSCLINSLEKTSLGSPELNHFFNLNLGKKTELFQKITNIPEPIINLPKKTCKDKRGIKTLELEHNETEFLIQLLNERKEWITAKSLTPIYSSALENVLRQLTTDKKSHDSRWLVPFNLHVYLATVLLAFLEWYEISLKEAKDVLVQNSIYDGEGYLQILIQYDLLKKLTENIRETYSSDIEVVNWFYRCSPAEQQKVLQQVL